MKTAFRSIPSQTSRSEALVHEIMRTFHLNRAEAVTVALGTVIRELIIAACAEEPFPASIPEIG